MRKSPFLLAGVAAVALWAMPGTASATSWYSLSCSLTPSPTQGTCGFVGKGDVQTAFSWNNPQLQNNASGLKFSYTESTTYDYTIEFDTGNEHHTEHHTITHTRTNSVSSKIQYDARAKNQVNGFLLTSQQITDSGGPVPNVGDTCPNGDLGTCSVTSVNVISTSGDGFDVTFGTTTVPVPNTTILP
jgi:hypothetical protein